MNEELINQLSAKYHIEADFLQGLYGKITDKSYFQRAVRMFYDGTMSYAIATGEEPIDVAALRHEVATNLWHTHQVYNKRMKDLMEQQQRIVDYYISCKQMTWVHKKTTKHIRDVVFIKDARIVAFGHFEHKQGGIYAADNEVMPDFHWQPHDHLARIRKGNKFFYRQVKKAASQSPREWFDFTFKPE